MSAENFGLGAIGGLGPLDTEFELGRISALGSEGENLETGAGER